MTDTPECRFVALDATCSAGRDSSIDWPRTLVTDCPLAAKQLTDWQAEYRAALDMYTPPD